MFAVLKYQESDRKNHLYSPRLMCGVRDVNSLAYWGDLADETAEIDYAHIIRDKQTACVQFVTDTLAQITELMPAELARINSFRTLVPQTDADKTATARRVVLDPNVILDYLQELDEPWYLPQIPPTSCSVDAKLFLKCCCL